MSRKVKGKKLLHRARSRGYYTLLALSLATLVVFSGCAQRQNYVKAIVAGGEAIELKEPLVKSVTIENDESGTYRFAVIYLSEKGNEELYNLFKRNVGRYISAFYGDILIMPNTYIAEPMKAGKIYFLLKSEKDEALARDIIRSYRMSH